jgi:hypothetical protein
MSKDNNMDEAFILYQHEIDELVRRGYHDAIKWIKQAQDELPNAKVEDLLAAAAAIVATDKSNVNVSDIQVSKEEIAFDETSIILGEHPEIVVSYDGKVASSEYTRKIAAPAGLGFDILDNKFGSEYTSDAPQLGEAVEDNSELKTKEADYRRTEATGFALGSDAEINIGHKDYVPPAELVVDMSVNAPNLAPTPSEMVEEGYGVETDIDIKSKEYVPPSELVIDNSIQSDIIEEPVSLKKSGRKLFGRKEKEQSIAYLPPKELDLEDNKNPSLQLEENASYQKAEVSEKKPDNKIVNEPEVSRQEVTPFSTPSFPLDEDAPQREYEFNYDQLAAELAAEKQRESVNDASEAYAQTDDVEPMQREKFIESYDLTEEQRRLALKFPERPNLNTRQIIKDIRSIDILE